MKIYIFILQIHLIIKIMIHICITYMQYMEYFLSMKNLFEEINSIFKDSSIFSILDFIIFFIILSGDIFIVIDYSIFIIIED